MKKILLIPICFLTLYSTAQKNVKIKRGKINSGGELIAEYGGKGGVFKPVHYTITAAGDTASLIKLDEVSYQAYNPLLKDAFYYEMHFSTHPGKTFYLRPAPSTIKILGLRDTNFVRKIGEDLIEQIFNDTLPVIIQNKAMNKDKVDELLTKVEFDYPRMLEENKLLDDSIGAFANYEIARDKSKPLVFRRIANTGRSTIDETYSIEQADVQLGKVVRIIDQGTSYIAYEFWKKGAHRYSTSK